MSGHLFCTTPNELKLHGDFLWNIWGILEPISTRGGPLGGHNPHGRQGSQARPGGLCSPRPTSGAHLLLYKWFWPRKNHNNTFGMERRRLEAELGQEHFCPPAERFCRGNFPPRGANHLVIITNNSPILGRAISIIIFNNTISSQTLVHILCSIFVPNYRLVLVGD